MAVDSFGTRLKSFRESQGLRQEDLANLLGMKKQTISNAENGQTGFSMDVMATLSTLGADLNWLLSGKGAAPSKHFHDSRGREVIGSGEFLMVPLLPQKVSAGHGQELLQVNKEEKCIPAPRKLANGDSIMAVEVRGDSMTGIQIFDGDYVFYCPGEVRGDGIYVLQVDGEALIKRLEFDPFAKKTIIHSENPRYPSRSEAIDSQSFIILGKVRGWIHAHPY